MQHPAWELLRQQIPIEIFTQSSYFIKGFFFEACSLDLLLKICHTLTHTHELLHATVCSVWQLQSPKLKQVNRICQGAIMIVCHEVGFFASLPSSSPPRSLLPQLVRANGPQCYPHATVDSPQCHSLSHRARAEPKPNKSVANFCHTT